MLIFALFFTLDEHYILVRHTNNQLNKLQPSLSFTHIFVFLGPEKRHHNQNKKLKAIAHSKHTCK
jgi:hypothetical protein